AVDRHTQLAQGGGEGRPRLGVHVVEDVVDLDRRPCLGLGNRVSVARVRRIAVGLPDQLDVLLAELRLGPHHRAHVLAQMDAVVDRHLDGGAAVVAVDAHHPADMDAADIDVGLGHHAFGGREVRVQVPAAFEWHLQTQADGQEGDPGQADRREGGDHADVGEGTASHFGVYVPRAWQVCTSCCGQSTLASAFT